MKSGQAQSATVMQAQTVLPRLHSDHLIENVAAPENARIVAVPVSESETK